MNLKRFIKDDKRKAPRIDVHLFCAIHQNSLKISGRIKNISSLGALIVIEEKIPFQLSLTTSTTLHLEFNSTHFAIPSSILRKQENKLFLNFLQEDIRLSAIINLINLGEDLF